MDAWTWCGPNAHAKRRRTLHRISKKSDTASRSAGNAARGVQIILEIDYRKEVITMAKKKGGCGCGCIEVKPAGKAPAKDKKEDRKPS